PERFFHVVSQKVRGFPSNLPNEIAGIGHGKGPIRREEPWPVTPAAHLRGGRVQLQLGEPWNALKQRFDSLSNAKADQRIADMLHWNFPRLKFPRQRCLQEELGLRAHILSVGSRKHANLCERNSVLLQQRAPTRQRG